MSLVLKDRFGRIHDYLRISLTDKCNLNCIYCNPQLPRPEKLAKKDILNFDELLRIISIFSVLLGFRKIRFTGGEPLLRKDIMKFFEALSPIKAKTGVEFAITTNGTLLEGNADALKRTGVDRINISLDSLRPGVFKYITGSDKLPEVIRSISALEEAGFENIKINTVIMRNVNDNEISEFVDYFKDHNVTLRFIEFMPFRNNGWSREAFIDSEEVKGIINKSFALEKLEDRAQIAEIYKVAGCKAKVGFIRPISQHFCGECNRLRLKADGKLKLCLFDPALREIDLKGALRSGSSDEDIIRIISESLNLKEKEHSSLSILALENKNTMQNIGG